MVYVLISSVERIRDPAGDHTAQASKTATAKVAQKTRLKKAKKKFDEIDEIFGF